MILKIICPILVLLILWFLNRTRRKLVEPEEKVIAPRLEFSDLNEQVKGSFSNLPRLKSNLNKFEGRGTVRVVRIVLGEDTIAAILYSWPYSLGQFRKSRGEFETLWTYSHIHWVEVARYYQGRGHLYRLMDSVISDTFNISSGITIDVEDPGVKELFKRKFEFKETEGGLILSYGDWS